MIILNLLLRSASLQRVRIEDEIEDILVTLKNDFFVPREETNSEDQRFNMSDNEGKNKIHRNLDTTPFMVHAFCPSKLSEIVLEDMIFQHFLNILHLIRTPIHDNLTNNSELPTVFHII